MQVQRMKLSGGEMKRYRIILDIIEGYINQKDGAEKLGLSTRQVRRLQERILQEGMSGVVHRNVGRPSNNRLSPEQWQKIKSLWESKYGVANFNTCHFTEKLNEDEGIAVSAETVRKYLRAEGLIDKKPRRRRVYRKQRPRKERFGELLQQDTSPHDWLGLGEKEHLVVVIDDATSKTLFAKLFPSDGTLPNMEAIFSVILRHGLPMAFYVDKASWFFYSGQGQKVHTHKANREAIESGDNAVRTQIGRALDQLGVELIAAGSPQAKGRVERANRTFQDRLVAELRLRKITNIDVANEFIEKVFLPDHNARFSREPQTQPSAFIPLANSDCLNDILCVKFTSTVRADNVIEKKGRYKLQLLPLPERISWAKAKVEVRYHLDKT